MFPRTDLPCEGFVRAQVSERDPGAPVDRNWKKPPRSGPHPSIKLRECLGLFTSLGGGTFSGHTPWFDGDWGKREQTVQDAI